jgi:hypothetical protein
MMGGPQWHKIHIKFHENPSTISIVEGADIQICKQHDDIKSFAFFKMIKLMIMMYTLHR